MIHNGVKRISYWNDSLNPFFKDRPTDNTSDAWAESPSPDRGSHIIYDRGAADKEDR